MDNIELERKEINEVIIGLFFIPDNDLTPFVTQSINKALDGSEYFTLGNYFKSVIQAVKDFEKRK